MRTCTASAAPEPPTPALPPLRAAEVRKYRIAAVEDP